MEDTFFRLLQFCTVKFETLWDPESKCYFPTRYELEGLAQFMFFGDLSEIRGPRLVLDVSPRNLQDIPIMGRGPYIYRQMPAQHNEGLTHILRTFVIQVNFLVVQVNLMEIP